MTRLQSVQNAAALVWCRAPVGMTTNRQCSTDFWFGGGWTLRSPPWSAACCPARCHHTWPPTVSSSLMRLYIGCVRPTRGRVSSDGPTASSVTDVLLLQAPSCDQSSSSTETSRR